MKIRNFELVSEIRYDSKYVPRAEAICPVCKNVFTARIYSLKYTQESCGCLRIKNVKKATTKHGDTTDGRVHPIYRAYMHMMERCYKPNTKQFHNYGGAGVTVCNEWRESYQSFKEWSLENGWRKGLEIDKDILSGKDKIYSPLTCKWVTHIENCQHTNCSAGATKTKGITQDKRKIPNKSYFGQKSIFGRKIRTKFFHTPEEAFEELQILINKDGEIE